MTDAGTGARPGGWAMKRGCDMRIDIRFLCPELVDTMNSGFYAVPEGATVRDLFHVCCGRNKWNLRKTGSSVSCFWRTGNRSAGTPAWTGLKKYLFSMRFKRGISQTVSKQSS